MDDAFGNGGVQEAAPVGPLGRVDLIQGELAAGASGKELLCWINNLLDSDPVKDPTHASYPYYNSSWYNSREIKVT